jgi:pectinesterase
LIEARSLYERAFEGTDLRGTRRATPWAPQVDSDASQPDALVIFDLASDRQNQFASVQSAIDHVVAAAKSDGARTRRYAISIGPGVFEGPIIVPKEAPPITIQGAGPKDTIISAGIDAGMSGADYATRFRKTISTSGAKSRDLFAKIIARQKLSTGNTAVLRLCSDDLSLSGLTVRNDYACDRDSSAPQTAEPDTQGRFAEGQHQAVALMLDGADRVVVQDCAISSFQDTLYLKRETGKCTRSFFCDSDIEGDVDFIFGGATAVFERCTIRSRGDRRAHGWALAPSTSLLTPYGFVFLACRFVSDSPTQSRAFLGRQWFEGVRATPYGTPDIPGYTCRLSDRNSLTGSEGHISRQTLESVGKCTLLECRLGPHLDPSQLWDDWASGAWTPRYRPVQTSIERCLELLRAWEPVNTWGEDVALKGTPWLSQIRSSFDAPKPS